MIKQLVSLLILCAGCKANSQASMTLQAGFFSNKGCGTLRFPPDTLANDATSFQILNADELIGIVSYPAEIKESVTKEINIGVEGCVESDDWILRLDDNVRTTTIRDSNQISFVK